MPPISLLGPTLKRLARILQNGYDYIMLPAFIQGSMALCRYV